MDFGDILDQWERQNTGAGGKKKSVMPNNHNSLKSRPTSLPKADPLDVWLRINGVYDKDAEADAAEHNRAAKRRRLREKRPDAVIDIHFLTRDEAWAALERFFNEARSKGFEKIRVIHGKGNHSRNDAVLKRSTREFIEGCAFAGESGQEKPANGGGGATWVLLK